MAIDFVDDMPVVGFKAFGGIIGKPAVGFTINGDTVVIVKTDQLAQPQRSRQRTDLMRNAFHQAAVAHKHIREVIDNLVVRLVELCRQRAFGNG